MDMVCDKCGICGGNNTCYYDDNSCDNILYNPPCDEMCEADEVVLDDECVEEKSIDCLGMYNGTGIMINGSTLLCCEKENIDCNGVCDGVGYIDSCGDCVGGSSSIIPRTDCEGVCEGPAYYNKCNQCVNGTINSIN